MLVHNGCNVQRFAGFHEKTKQPLLAYLPVETELHQSLFRCQRGFLLRDNADQEQMRICDDGQVFADERKNVAGIRRKRHTTSHRSELSNEQL
jgi:hypothetical protein